MTRRAAIAGLAGLAVAPERSSAQQAPAKIPRVGWIWLGGRSAGNSTEVAGFGHGLKEHGYIEGQNIIVEYRFGEGRRDRLADLVAELVAPFTTYPQETGELLLKYRVPAVSELRRIAESGGLLSYGPNLFDAMRRLAYFVDRILKGTRPADLPVEQATKLELVVNVKAARALGLTIPPLIFARADEVID